jgi:alpha-ribazole phosphatase
MSLTLYFLRHGQTSLSREDVFCGSGLDPELTSDGLKMAYAFRDAYRDTAWRAIYSSRLLRSVATAEQLATPLD